MEKEIDITNTSIPDKTGNENKANINADSNKALYKKGLWMYFSSIKNKFFFDRTKAKALLYIISQKNEIEYEYSESLKYLYNQFISQFDNYMSSSHSKAFNENSLNITINFFINNLKYESELYANHSKEILNNIIKPLEGFIMNQCEMSYELIGLMESYEKEFKLVCQQIEQKKNNFQQAGKNIEIALNKLELMKKKQNSKDEEKNSGSKLFNVERNDNGNDNENDAVKKFEDLFRRNTDTAKLLRIEYEEYIKQANDEREKYIKLCDHIYDRIQNLDEEYIKTMKNHLQVLIDKELNLIENIKKDKINILQYINKINIENDIKVFINSKITKFDPPKPFEYMDYKPDVILRYRKSHNGTIQKEINMRIMNNLNKIFKFEKPTSNLMEEENINFINETVNDIWDGLDYNNNKLELLFKEHIYRLRFLRMLNQYRVEGIFLLQNLSFKNFCMIISSLLDKSIEYEDYECIKFCMILSQTFYLQGEKKVSLQSGIALNQIWQDKNFWKNIIEYSIYEDLNISKGYIVFLKEDLKTREKRVESTIISNLITFLFNMKLFGYSEEDTKIVIDEFIEKYNIDKKVVYASDVSMKEIKDDIIFESVDNIVKNDITEENGNDNKLRRDNTNKSQKDEK